MMQQTIKGTAMSVGGIFVPSLEGFATVINYFNSLRYQNLITLVCIKNKSFVSDY